MGTAPVLALAAPILPGLAPLLGLGWGSVIGGSRGGRGDDGHGGGDLGGDGDGRGLAAFFKLLRHMAGDVNGILAGTGGRGGRDLRDWRGFNRESRCGLGSRRKSGREGCLRCRSLRGVLGGLGLADARLGRLWGGTL